MPSPLEQRRIAFLVEELGRSGGMAVVRQHARHLIEAEGARCELLVCAPRPGELPAEDSGVPVRRLSDALDEPVDVAIATWWTTAEALFELPARRRVLFMQNLEHRFYGGEDLADRLGAFGVLDLPVDFIVIASHMERLLAGLRPDARVLRVPNGIDKDTFRPAGERRAEGPLRVLVEGQPTLWFKAVPEAVACVRAMREPASVTVAAHDPADAKGIDADRVVGSLSAREMAALYGEHDVLLKLSRFEGLPLPPLEAFHVGLPCVLTPFTGGEDYVRHGENALVVGFDDEPGTSGALDRLARDPALRSRLSAGALETAARWPDRSASSSSFAEALRTFLETPPPAHEPSLRRLMRSRRLAIELLREQQRQERVRLEHTRGEVRWWTDAYEQTKEAYEAALDTFRNRKAVRLADAVNARLRRR